MNAERRPERRPGAASTSFGGDDVTLPPSADIDATAWASRIRAEHGWVKHTIEVGPEAPGSQIRRRRTAANRCTALDTGHRDPWQRQPVPWRRDPAIAAWWTLNDLGLLTDPRWRQVIEDTLRGPV